MGDDEFEIHLWSMRGRLLHHAQRRLGGDAEDVVAETLLTLWRKGLAAPADEAQRCHLHAMAFLVLKGHIRNHQRARWRYEALVAAAAQAATLGRRHHEDEDAESADTLLEGWLALLPEADRQIVRLRAGGFTAAEISARLGCSRSAAAKRSARAAAKLLAARQQG